MRDIAKLSDLIVLIRTLLEEFKKEKKGNTSIQLMVKETISKLSIGEIPWELYNEELAIIKKITKYAFSILLIVLTLMLGQSFVDDVKYVGAIISVGIIIIVLFFGLVYFLRLKIGMNCLRWIENITLFLIGDLLTSFWLVSYNLLFRGANTLVAVWIFLAILSGITIGFWFLANKLILGRDSGIYVISSASLLLMFLLGMTLSGFQHPDQAKWLSQLLDAQQNDVFTVMSIGLVYFIVEVIISFVGWELFQYVFNRLVFIKMVFKEARKLQEQVSH